jgi:hypothetical protein
MPTNGPARYQHLAETAIQAQIQAQLQYNPLPLIVDPKAIVQAEEFRVSSR